MLKVKNILKHWVVFIYAIAFAVVVALLSALAIEISSFNKDSIVHAKVSSDFIEMMKPSVIEKNKNNKDVQLSAQELKETLKKAGFTGKHLRQAWGVAMKESNGRPNAHNKNSSTRDNSYGIFQINMIGALGTVRREQFDLKTNKDLFDPARNAEIAYFMSDGGKNWSAWNGITTKTREKMVEFPR